MAFKYESSRMKTLRDTSKKMESAFHEITDDITFPQFLVLGALQQVKEANQTLIVTNTGIDRSTLSTMLLTLINNGYIKRVQNGADKRANVITPTHKGKLAYQRGLRAAARVEKDLDSLT